MIASIEALNQAFSGDPGTHRKLMIESGVSVDKANKIANKMATDKAHAGMKGS